MEAIVAGMQFPPRQANDTALATDLAAHLWHFDGPPLPRAAVTKRRSSGASG